MNTEPKLYEDGVWARPIDKEKDAPKLKSDEWRPDGGLWCRVGLPEREGEADGPFLDEYEYRRPVPAPERRKDAVEQGAASVEQWTAEKVKTMLDSWGLFLNLPAAEYERIAREHNADMEPTPLSEIRSLAAKAEAMRDIPNEHERKLYEAITRTRRGLATPMQQGHEPWPGTPGAQNEDTARLTEQEIDALVEDICHPYGNDTTTERLRVRKIIERANDAARGVQPAAQEGAPAAEQWKQISEAEYTWDNLDHIKATDAKTNENVYFRRAPSPAREKPETASVEHGWVIEKGPMHEPKYLSVSERRWDWTTNHLVAIRFARKQDAVSVHGHFLLEKVQARICEHAWESDALATASPEEKV